MHGPRGRRILVVEGGTMKHILVGYEEDGLAERVLERSAELAKAFGARVTVASVTPIPVRFGRGIGPYDPADPPARHEVEVSRAIARLEQLGVRNVRGAPLAGDPGDEIVRVARAHGADLIVVGAHHGGVWSRFFERAVDDEVAHHSPVDVLIVH
jgi:nucleotide-binding universal stress UspA family protein